MSRQASASKWVAWNAACKLAVGAEGLSGAALVEFTVFAPILLAATIYTIDFGLLLFTKIEVQNAAQAGAQYAIVKDGYDAAAISSAMTRTTRFTAITPTSSEFCGCPAATQVTFCSASCDTCSACSASVQGHYVTVTATPTSPYTPLIRNPFVAGVVANSYDISAKSTVRIR